MTARQHLRNGSLIVALVCAAAAILGLAVAPYLAGVERARYEGGLPASAPMNLLLNLNRWFGGRLPWQMLPGVIYLLIVVLLAVAVRRLCSAPANRAAQRLNGL